MPKLEPIKTFQNPERGHRGARRLREKKEKKTFSTIYTARFPPHTSNAHPSVSRIAPPRLASARASHDTVAPVGSTSISRPRVVAVFPLSRGATKPSPYPNINQKIRVNISRRGGGESRDSDVDHLLSLDLINSRLKGESSS